MRRKGAEIAPGFRPTPLTRLLRRRINRLLLGLARADTLLQIFQSQRQLIGGQRFGASAELVAQ
jgi:hypothetical protein